MTVSFPQVGDHDACFKSAYLPTAYFLLTNMICIKNNAWTHWKPIRSCLGRYDGSIFVCAAVIPILETSFTLFKFPLFSATQVQEYPMVVQSVKKKQRLLYFRLAAIPGYSMCLTTRPAPGWRYIILPPSRSCIGCSTYGLSADRNLFVTIYGGRAINDPE